MTPTALSQQSSAPEVAKSFEVGVDALIHRMFTTPLEFVLRQFTLDHKPSGLEIWVGNGFWFYGPYRPAEFGFSFWEKIKFARALKKWRRAWLAAKLAS